MKQLIATALLAMVSLGAAAADQTIVDRYNKACTFCHAAGVSNAPKAFDESSLVITRLCLASEGLPDFTPVARTIFAHQMPNLFLGTDGESVTRSNASRTFANFEGCAIRPFDAVNVSLTDVSQRILVDFNFGSKVYVYNRSLSS